MVPTGPGYVATVTERFWGPAALSDGRHAYFETFDETLRVAWLDYRWSGTMNVVKDEIEARQREHNERCPHQGSRGEDPERIRP